MGIILSLIAVIFGAAPVLLSDDFVFITILSALPIYIITKIDSKIGLIAYGAAGFLSAVIDMDIGIFFFLAHGPLGYTLGIWSCYFEEKIYTCLISGIVLTITFSSMKFILGISSIIDKVPGIVILQIPLFFILVIIYSYLYLTTSTLVYNILNKYYYLDLEN